MENVLTLNKIQNATNVNFFNNINFADVLQKDELATSFENINPTDEKDFNKKDLLEKLWQNVNDLKDKISKEIKSLDVKDIAKGAGGGLLGAALAYATFSFALLPLSFLLQLLFSGGISVKLPAVILQILRNLLGLGVIASNYGSAITGFIGGFKTTTEMTKNQDPTYVDELKISLEKFKNSQSFIDYVRNGFNLGVEWGKETNAKAGNWANIPLAAAASLVMMAPLALLGASLGAPFIGLLPSLALGLIASLPLGIKTFNTVKNFAKEVYGFIGGAIGGAVGGAIGGISKLFNTVKGLLSKKEKKQTDEFQQNSPYKNQGIEKMMESTGKVVENFIKGTSDVLSFSSLINNILTKEPTGLGTVASLVGGTVKSFEGANILKSAALNNKPQDFKVGLFRFLSGFSLILSFLGPLFGPLGVVGFSLASLIFMGLEKFFEVKNKLSKNEENKNDQNTLKNSYAIGAAGGQFVDSLGSLGKFWMGWDTIFGGGYGGLTSIFGIIGSTRDILQGAKMMQMASERNNIGVGVQGLINVVGGVSLLLAAIGLGRVFGAVSLGMEIAKIVLQIKSLLNKQDVQFQN
ncbi:MAG: hypothetical protein ACK4GR_00850 [bacterium]